MTLQAKPLLPLLVGSASTHENSMTRSVVDITVKDFNEQLESQFHSKFKKEQLKPTLKVENQIKLIKRTKVLLSQLKTSSNSTQITPTQPRVNILLRAHKSPIFESMRKRKQNGKVHKLKTLHHKLQQQQQWSNQQSMETMNTLNNLDETYDPRQYTLLNIKHKIIHSYATQSLLSSKQKPDIPKFTLKKLNKPPSIQTPHKETNQNEFKAEIQNTAVHNTSSQLPPKPSTQSRMELGQKKVSRNFNNSVDKSILQKSVQDDQERLQQTLEYLQKDFFSCPLVDVPDPQEKQLFAYQQGEIMKFLKQEKDTKLQVKKLTLQMDQIENSISQLNQRQKDISFSQKAKYELQEQNQLLQKISQQLLEKTQLRTSLNLHKLKGFNQKRPQYKNEEIRRLDNEDRDKGLLYFHLDSPSDPGVMDIRSQKQDKPIMDKEEVMREIREEEDKYAVYQERIAQIMKQITKKIDDEKEKKSDMIEVKIDDRDRKKQLFVRSLIDCVQQMKEMDLTPEMIMSGKVFPKIPFQKGKLSREYFHAAKIGDHEAVAQMVKRDRFLVYEFDHVHQTALHWAAKRNKAEVIKVLIRNGVRTNQKDMGGRTALFLASKANNLQAVKALLAGKANPNIRTFSGATPIMVATNQKIRGFIAKALLLHICLPLINARRRNIVWELEGLAYFESPDHVSISDFA